MIILDLVLKRHWYDLIRSGKKHAEYREIKPYWTTRLLSKPYTHVRFRRGYTRESILFEITEITESCEANDLKLDKVYRINFGKRLTHEE